MAMKREYGQEQPYIPAGIFKIRLPFIHYRWEISECLQAIFMCATCLGAIPTLQSVMGVSYDVAWSMVIINGFFYSIHALLGDPVVPGWITPSIPLTTAFLTMYEEGAVRNQHLIALQMEVGIIFLVMGITGLAQKVIDWIPASLKAGILLGAGIAAIAGEFVEGGRFNLYPITVGVGALFAYFLLFSALFKKWMFKYKWAKLLGNFGMLPAIILAVIIGPLSGELPAPILEIGSVFKIPNFAAIIEEISPLGPTGWPGVTTFITCIPTAFSIYIIAFGDFVSAKALIEEGGEARPDEKIDFNANRSNLCSAIRNLVQCVIAPYVSMCGPLWAAVTASVAERYKKGREEMDSIFSGVGTFRWMTFICVACVPIANFVQPILPAALSLTLLVQGYVCGRIAVDEMKTDEDKGIACVVATILYLKGSAWGLAVGIILYILVCLGGEEKKK